MIVFFFFIELFILWLFILKRTITCFSSKNIPELTKYKSGHLSELSTFLRQLFFFYSKPICFSKITFL
jgi:hypothetical protein